MKLIPLTQGKFAQVDDEDYDYLMQWKWHTYRDNNDIWYATRSPFKINGISQNTRMHRVILGLTNPNIFGDHKDGDGLNNQRINLRICTIKENNRNKKSGKNTSSMYVGVYWRQSEQKWTAKLRSNGKDYFLGRFINEVDAAKAYNTAALVHHKEFANLNKV